MALRAPIRHSSREEYLALERAVELKSEYIDGAIFAMSGGSRRHSLIATNVASELRNLLRDHPCEVHGSDLRVNADLADLYTYPDVTVICGDPEFEDAENDTLRNPTVLIEVLSPSTEAYDRGEKFARYRLLPSLRAYVLVAEDLPRVEWYVRGPDGWVLHEAKGMDAAVVLLEPACTVALSEVYAKVVFGAEQAIA